MKIMARERKKQKNYQVLSQLKGLPGSATIKRTTNDGILQPYGFQGVSQSKGLSGTATFKVTAREYHNQKKCQGVPQSQSLRGVSELKKYQGVSQSK